MKRGETNAEIDLAQRRWQAVADHVEALNQGRACACEGPHTGTCLIDDGTGGSLALRAEMRIG